MKVFRKLVITITLTLHASWANAALIIDWEYTALGFESGSGAPPVISGTIAGLVEGENDGSGLSILLDSLPGGALLDQDWMFDSARFGGPAFVVTGGEVTLANASFFNGDGDILRFGTEFSIPALFWLPGLFVSASGDNFSNCVAVDRFSIKCSMNRFASRADVPIPSTAILMCLALLVLACKNAVGRLTRYR